MTGAGNGVTIASIIASIVASNAGNQAENAGNVLAKTGWRIEVTRNGQYWQWRKGSKGERKSKYGGKFDTLDEARREAYWQNVKTHSRAGAGDPAAGDSGN